MTGRARVRRVLVGVLAAGVLAPALLTGCAQSVDPIERLGRKAAQKVPPRKPGQSALPGCGQALRKAEALREAEGMGTASPASSPESGRQGGGPPGPRQELPDQAKRCAGAANSPGDPSFGPPEKPSLR